MGVNDTEPRILLDSIRSPNKFHGESMESTGIPSGVHTDSTWTSLKVRAIMWSQTIPLCSRYTPSRILMDSIRKHTIEGLLLQSCQHQSRSPYGLHLESIKCQINIIPTQKIMPTSGFEHPTSNKWPKWTRLTAELPVHKFMGKIGS